MNKKLKTIQNKIKQSKMQLTRNRTGEGGATISN